MSGAVASAQPATAQNTGNATKKTAKAAPKPAPKPAATAAAARSDYWSVNYTVSDQFTTSRTRPRNDNPVSSGQTHDMTAELGRVPSRVGPGTVGFTTQSNIRGSEFMDGRPVPGLEANTQKSSSFVGMSLSVSSNSKTLPILLPAPTPWNRDE